ncbi:MAG: lipocalin family protein [Gemmatimonadetes bacterium]|nr:lipocalin family protein [Gemmatimonadota bacterium]
MNARTVLLTVGVVALGGCGRSSTAANGNPLVGTWNRDGWAYEQLTFRADGSYRRFEYELGAPRATGPDTLRTDREDGTYQLAGDTLHLHIAHETYRDFQDPTRNYEGGGSDVLSKIILDANHLVFVAPPSHNPSTINPNISYTRAHR